MKHNLIKSIALLSLTALLFTGCSNTAAVNEPEVPKPEINWVMANLPTERSWIDDLYNKLVTDDYEGVLEILKDDSIAEKAVPYLYEDYVYDSYGYKLVTSDGKFVGLQLPIDMTSNSGRHAWCSENEDTYELEEGDVLSVWEM